MRSRLLSCLLLALAPVLRATTVVPPSFPELVSEADGIYRGQVTAVEARRVTQPSGDSVIKTFVTVAVERALKGPTQKEVVLEFLGGTVGADTLTVSGMPKFTVGQREIVFVQKNGVQFCPLVAMMHGRYHVLHDATSSRDFVARDNGAPLTDVADIQRPLHETPGQLRAGMTPAAANALSPTAFEASIASEAQRSTLQARPN
jgi:hypothetical protein